MDEGSWEYRVETFGSWIRSPKDGQLTEALNELGEQDWELTGALPREGSQALTLILRRRVTREERRRRTRPGETW